MKTASLTPITEALIGRVCERIVAVCRPEAIYLFGSAARGEAGPGSDLDLLVVMALPDGTKPYEKAGELRRLFDGWRVPLDILVQTPKAFAEARSMLGHLAYTATHGGRLLYRRAADA